MSTLSQVLSLGVGSETDILAAMRKVNDANNIHEIVNFLLDADFEDAEFKEQKEELRDEVPQEPVPAQQEDFMMHCHKCDTWHVV